MSVRGTRGSRDALVFLVVLLSALPAAQAKTTAKRAKEICRTHEHPVGSWPGRRAATGAGSGLGTLLGDLGHSSRSSSAASGPVRIVLDRSPEVVGALDEQLVQKTFRRNRRGINHCYERTAAKTQVSDGEVRLRLIIDPKGWVDGVTAERSTLPPELVNCLRVVIAKIQFMPPYDKSAATITYDLEIITGHQKKSPWRGLLRRGFSDVTLARKIDQARALIKRLGVDERRGRFSAAHGSAVRAGEIFACLLGSEHPETMAAKAQRDRLATRVLEGEMIAKANAMAARGVRLAKGRDIHGAMNQAWEALGLLCPHLDPQDTALASAIGTIHQQHERYRASRPAVCLAEAKSNLAEVPSRLRQGRYQAVIHVMGAAEGVFSRQLGRGDPLTRAAKKHRQAARALQRRAGLEMAAKMAARGRTAAEKKKIAVAIGWYGEAEVILEHADGDRAAALRAKVMTALYDLWDSCDGSRCNPFPEVSCGASGAAGEAMHALTDDDLGGPAVSSAPICARVILPEEVTVAGARAAIAKHRRKRDRAGERRALIGLARRHYQRGELEIAEITINEATVLHGRLKQKPAELIEDLRLLANIQWAKGDYRAARETAERGLKLVPKRSLHRATLLNTLALVRLGERDFDAAIRLFEEILSDRRDLLGEDNPLLAPYLSNSAIAYWKKGDNDRALERTQRARGLLEQLYGDRDARIGALLSNIAILQRARGDLDAAEASATQALGIQEERLGVGHPKIARTVENLASITWERGDLAQTVTHLGRSVAIQEKQVALQMASGRNTEAQKLAFVESLRETSETVIAMQQTLGRKNTAAAELALRTLLQRKGRALEAQVEAVAALRASLDERGLELLAEWSETVGILASTSLEGPGQDPAAHRSELLRLEKEANDVAGRLAARSALFGARHQPVTIDDVRHALPADAALLEYTVFRPYDVKARIQDEVWGKPRYALYVLVGTRAVAAFDLGPVDEIDGRVAQFRKALLRCEALPCAEMTGLAERLFEELVAPALSVAGNAGHLILAPDGELNLLPFAALRSSSSRLLIEERLLTHVTSGRDLVTASAAVGARGGPLILASPTFASHSRQGRDTGPGLRGAGLHELDWPDLPGTAAEADAISPLMDKPQILRGSAATETALKAVRGPAILHIATHGFFLAESTSTSAADSRGLVIKNSLEVEASSRRRGSDPLLRSGLVLAGGNRLRGDGTNDGVATAREIAGLDLFGTELVVLSACETGVGEARYGQGVHGLRRALALAGAEAQVISLWQVSDIGTRDLMVAYYQALYAGQGRSQALRTAQLALLKGQRWASPFFWAAFIASGSWRPLGE